MALIENRKQPDAPDDDEEALDLASRLTQDHHQSLKLWLRMLSCTVKIENEIRSLTGGISLGIEVVTVHEGGPLKTKEQDREHCWWEEPAVESRQSRRRQYEHCGQTEDHVTRQKDGARERNQNREPDREEQPKQQKLTAPDFPTLGPGPQ